MMYRLLALFLVLTLSASAKDYAVKARALPAGASIELGTADGKTLKGRLLEAGDTALRMQAAENKAIVERSVSYSDIRWMRQTGNALSGKAKLGIVVLVFGLLSVMGAILGG
jgi:hypothetical protein